MILALDCADGIVKVGSPPEELPGILEHIKIRDSLLFENAGMEGRSGKVKIVDGWDDADLQITLSLIDGTGQTRWDCLKQITGVFKKVADDGKPEVYTLSHPMADAWKVKELLFSSLETAEYRTRRKIEVNANFVEYDPSSGVIQDRQSAANTPVVDEASLAAAQERMLVSDSQRAGLGKQEERFARL